MKKFIFLILLLASNCLADGEIWLPNIPGYATGTASGGKNGLDVNINSGTIVVAPQVNTAGSFSQLTNVGSSGASTFTAPLHAVAFVIETSSSNAQNVRYAIGATATTTAGMRLEPGRSEYYPIDANISVIAEAGSNQEVDVQWVLSQ